MKQKTKTKAITARTKRQAIGKRLMRKQVRKATRNI